MKKYFPFIVIAVAAVAMWCMPTSVASNRDYEFEHYCDSIWDADPDFYMDVLEETDYYQDYIELNGKWWEI